MKNKILTFLALTLSSFVIARASITHVDAVPNGLVAHWSVSDQNIVRTLSHQSAGYTNAQVTTWGTAGNVIDNRLFTTGDRIFIDLPAGQWLYEAGDGVSWHNVLGNQTDSNGNPAMLTGGPGVHVQIFVDSEAGAKEIWSRCTLLGISASAPAPFLIPAISQLTTNVTVLQTNVNTINAILKRHGLR
jgi:hypothetical protein